MFKKGYKLSNGDYKVFKGGYKVFMDGYILLKGCCKVFERCYIKNLKGVTHCLWGYKVFYGVTKSVRGVIK